MHLLVKKQERLSRGATVDADEWGQGQRIAECCSIGEVTEIPEVVIMWCRWVMRRVAEY